MATGLNVRLTILIKGLLLIAIPLLFQLIFVALLVRALADSTEADNRAIHTKDVLVKAESAFVNIVRAHSENRAFVITGDEGFATNAETARLAGDAVLKELATLVRDDPVQHARVVTMQLAAHGVHEWINQLNALIRAGSKAEAENLIASLAGARRVEMFRNALEEFVAHEQEIDRQRLAEVGQTRSSLRWVMGGGTFGAVLTTCFIAFVFSRSVSHRLHVVTQNAEAIASNKPLAEPLRGSDEIARLDAVLHETSRRLAAAAQAERGLKLELENRAAALASANESLRQQTQENEMFVYSVSHDLRSPLVNLQGFSQELSHAGNELRQMLSDERVPTDIRSRVIRVLESDVVDSVHFIQSAVTRSAAIIDALLRLSRAGRVEYRLRRVDVAAIVRRVIDAMSNTIAGKKAEVIAHELPECWADATAVEQVFGNLIGNAVNYLDPARPGRVEIGVSDEAGSFREGLRTYYVRDNGLGIPAAYLAKVFVAFQRLHGDIAKGEGIGLALVRRMIDRHGGEIWVESTERVGTTFYVALPMDEPEQTPAVSGPATVVEAKV